MTGSLYLRKADKVFASAGKIGRSSATLLPSVSPQPPGSQKSRCMSITISAIESGAKENRPGWAGTLIVVWAMWVSLMIDFTREWRRLGSGLGRRRFRRDPPYAGR